MAGQAQLRDQIAREEERRSRLAVPAFGGGFLYLLSAIIITSTLNSLPSVGPLQGLAPALSGVAEPAESPRAPEVRYISHHAFQLIAGSVLAAVAIVILTLIVLLLFDATRFRRPETWPPARILTLVGGLAVAVCSVAHEVVYAIETHSFTTGHDFTSRAVDNALTTGTANQVVAYLSLLSALALVSGMVVVLLNSLRVGLVPRWMGFLGMFSALLILLPNVGATLQLIPAFWLVMMGMLLSKRWPGGDPPAWEAGEARPWPSRAEMQQARRSGAGRPAAAAGASTDASPAPRTPAASGSSRKRRRKRSGRG